MTAPLTVTVDLAALGMRYDEDGDPAGRQTFEDAVIEAAAVKLLADTKEARHALKERVQHIRDEELRAAIAGEVRAAMDLPIQRTSQWGEAKGEAVTVDAFRKEFDTDIREARKAITDKVTELALAATKQLISKPR